MKVILQNDVMHLGRAGDVVRVKSGFARNYLLPRKLALPVHSQSVKEWNHKKKIAELKAKKAQMTRDEVAKKLNGHKVSIKKMGTPNGKLFGSVSAFEIASTLKSNGFHIDKKFIQIKNPIKTVGSYKIQIDFGKDTKAEMEVSVSSEQEEKRETALNTESSKSAETQESEKPTPSSD